MSAAKHFANQQNQMVDISFLSQAKNKLIILIALILSTNSSSAQKRFNHGYGLSIHQSRIRNIDTSEYLGYGHSEPGFTKKNQLNIGVTYLLELRLSKRLSIESGFGYMSQRSQFHFKYFRNITQKDVDVKLNIMLHYLKIPLTIQYYETVGKSLLFNTGIGIDIKYNFWYNDNFQENIFYARGGLEGKYRYTNFIFSPQTNIGFISKLKNNKRFHFLGMAGFDLQNFINPTWAWGFYENLQTASFVNYGISVKYYLID